MVPIVTKSLSGTVLFLYMVYAYRPTHKTVNS